MTHEIRHRLVPTGDGDGFVHPADPGEPGYDGQHKRVSVTPLEAEMLAVMFTGMKVLEVGTGLGVSTAAIARTCQELVTIDPDAWVGANIAPHLPQRVAFVQCFEAIRDSQLLKGRYFDGAFIDGCHREHQVAADVRNALRRLRPGGLLVLHDFSSQEVRDGARAAGIDPFHFHTRYGLGIYFVPQEQDAIESPSRHRQLPEALAVAICTGLQSALLLVSLFGGR